MMAALGLPETPAAASGDAPGGASVPDWVHLLPAGRIETFDGRGPYEVADAQAVIEASLGARGDIEVDVNHATFAAAPEGRPSPAAGWIRDMQARADGIWGRVEWTEEGRRLVAGRAWRRISPVIRLAAKGSRTIVAILNASLVNRNNLRGLTALNREGDGAMALNDRLAKILGLADGADEDTIAAAVAALLAPPAGAETGATGAAAPQAQIDGIGAVLGVEAGGDVLAAARGNATALVALQGEIAGLAGELETLRQSVRRGAAEAFVDGAIRAARVAVKPQRARLIAMHMADPEGTEALVNAFPVLGPSGATALPPEPKGGTIALSAEQAEAVRLLGIPPDDYQAQLMRENAKEESIR